MNNKKVSAIPLTWRAVGGAITFAANMLFGRMLNLPSPRGPLVLTWLLTYDCNLSCKFCSTHKVKKNFPEDVSLDRALEIADEIGRIGTWVVGFTGGEVFLSPILFPLIQRLKSYGVVVYIITNGLDLKENTEAIISSGVDYIVVSIDSHIPESHDNIRNHDGLFQKVFENINYFKSQRKGLRPLIKTRTVLHKENLENINQTLQYLDDIVDIVTVQPIVYGYINHPHSKKKEQMDSMVFSDTADEKQSAIDMLAKIAQRRAELKSFYYRNIPTFWFDPESLANEVHCWSPFIRLTLEPNGAVRYCQSCEKFAGVLGNIKEQSIMEIWNCQEMIRQREILRTHNNNCICWSSDTAFNATLHEKWIFNKIPIFRKK
jgi:MoaA/NifB/PqqE/SkfB family radical SAM enzyme